MSKDKNVKETKTEKKSKRPHNKGMFKRGQIQTVTVPIYQKGEGIVGYAKEQRIAQLVKIGNKKIMIHLHLPEKKGD